MSDAPDPLPSGRLAGLDAARALLMLGGLLLHATSWQEPRPLFGLVTLVSQAFRMGAFFAISGFLAGMALRHRSPGAWLKRRFVQVGVPCLVGLLTVPPLMYFIVSFRLHPEVGTGPLLWDWYHLWFLVALLLYSMLAYVAERLDARFDLFERAVRPFCSGDISLMPLLCVVSSTAFALMVLASDAVATLCPATWVRTATQWRWIAGYAPLYLLGLALARSCGLRGSIARDWRSPAAILFAVGAVYTIWFQALAGQVSSDRSIWWSGMIPILGAALCAPAAFMLIFRAALKLPRIPRALALLSDASFTIYIVHLPIVVAINIAFQRTAWSPYLEYAIAVVVGGLLSYGFHALLVRPSKVLSFLLNGKYASGRLPSTSAPASAEPRILPL